MVFLEDSPSYLNKTMVQRVKILMTEPKDLSEKVLVEDLDECRADEEIGIKYSRLSDHFGRYRQMCDNSNLFPQNT